MKLKIGSSRRYGSKLYGYDVMTYICRMQLGGDCHSVHYVVSQDLSLGLNTCCPGHDGLRVLPIIILGTFLPNLFLACCTTSR